MDDAIRALASEAGIANDWIDAADQPRQVSIEALRRILEALRLPCATKSDIVESRARLRSLQGGGRPLVTATVGEPIRLPDADLSGTAELALESGRTERVALRSSRGRVMLPPIRHAGYHRIRVADREIGLAVAPARCFSFDDIAPNARMFGLAVQLYALRGRTESDVGDTAALSELVECAAREGADAVALSPVHSLFGADHSHYSPYSPSSRLFLNPLYADPAIVLGEARVSAALARIQPSSTSSRDKALIDWPAAGQTKMALLRVLFDDFRRNDLETGSRLKLDFESYTREAGARLHEHALFEAAHEHWCRASPPVWNWRDWPTDWRSPRGAAIARFADAEERAVAFQKFLQWTTARSFSAVQDVARSGGMRVGLITDVAVGMSPGGSHAWSRQEDLLLDLSIGAPADHFNPRGQDWGLTGFSPQALVASGFEPFIATLRTAMRHAGGVRIDHAMGLTRLWLIPHGAPPNEGAYLAYPIDDLLRIAALESHRHRVVVIGEDLGTVPPEFRERAAEAGIAGMDVLRFQRDKQRFMPPRTWRRDAVAMTTTHDLPTVAGWWQGADIATRSALGLVNDDASEVQQRAEDRSALWQAFREAGAASGDEPPLDRPAPAVDGAIAFTAQSPAPLALIPIEDVLGIAEQPNLPGTIDEHPNWRRRLGKPVPELLDGPEARSRLKTLRERRR